MSGSDNAADTSDDANFGELTEETADHARVASLMTSSADSLAFTVSPDGEVDPADEEDLFLMVSALLVTACESSPSLHCSSPHQWSDSNGEQVQEATSISSSALSLDHLAQT